MIMQVHRFEPLSEGSVSDFTLWLGPVPIHWIAIHSNVDFPRGFTDSQQQGPMKYWSHTHTFSAENERVSRVSEHIEYEHRSGLPGLLSRLLFSGPGLHLLFAYRQMTTRRILRKRGS
jgi:ligand-binding SRPBCC domain-containing protein